MKMKMLLFILSVMLIFTLSRLTFAQYTPGTYKGTAIGKSDAKHTGVVEVEVVVSGTKIENIKVLTYEQTSEGKYGELTTEAKAKIPAAILEKQSVGVDAITKATISSNAIKLAVAKALEKAYLKKYVPGTYKGTAIGKSDAKHSGVIDVEVTVSETKIESIKIVTYEQTSDGKYGELTAEAKAKIPASIIEKQSVDVDVITKATLSSGGIQLAVVNALEKARAK